MKQSQHDNTKSGFSLNDILKDKHEVVKADEERNCKKIRVEEFSYFL